MKRKKRTTHSKGGRRETVPPWLTLPSLRAKLPTDRAAWLAIVLPAIDRAPTYPRAGKLLAEQGHDLGDRPGIPIREWVRWLTTAQAAGLLPERSEPFPVRLPGGVKGDQPSPTSGVGRKIAAKREAATAPSAASDTPAATSTPATVSDAS